MLYVNDSKAVHKQQQQNLTSHVCDSPFKLWSLSWSLVFIVELLVCLHRHRLFLGQTEFYVNFTNIQVCCYLSAKLICPQLIL